MLKWPRHKVCQYALTNKIIPDKNRCKISPKKPRFFTRKRQKYFWISESSVRRICYSRRYLSIASKESSFGISFNGLRFFLTFYNVYNSFCHWSYWLFLFFCLSVFSYFWCLLNGLCWLSHEKPIRYKIASLQKYSIWHS